MLYPSLVESGPQDLTIDNAPADAAEATDIRRSVETWLLSVPVDEEVRGDITLAVYEAVANVVDHAYRHIESGGTVSVHASYTAHVCEVTVADHGRWIIPVPNPNRGYGIPLIHTLSTDAVIGHTDLGTSVVMRWDVVRG